MEENFAAGGRDEDRKSQILKMTRALSHVEVLDGGAGGHSNSRHSQTKYGVNVNHILANINNEH